MKGRVAEGVSPNSKTPFARATDGVDSRNRIDGSLASPGTAPSNVKVSPNDKRLSGNVQDSLSSPQIGGIAAAPTLSPQNSRTGAAAADVMDTLSSEDLARNVGEGMLRYVLYDVR